MRSLRLLHLCLRLGNPAQEFLFDGITRVNADVCRQAALTGALGHRLTRSTLCEQQRKNGSGKKTNLHHDLLCFSIERNKDALKTGVSFRVSERDDSSRTKHAGPAIDQAFPYNDGIVRVKASCIS
jgi:hypothetical protein